MTSGTKVNLDTKGVQQLQGQVVRDLGAATGVACAFIGDRLGLYKAMAKSGPTTSQDLSKATSTNERYIREWLLNQASGGYINYDPKSGKYALTAEQAAVLADEDSPFFCGGGFQAFLAFVQATPRMVTCIKEGTGLSWADQDPNLFEGTARFFKPSYVGQLVSTWIPAVDGLKAKLEAGAVVADVGCGHGLSTIIMAKAFPKSKFYGFDNHEPSIIEARAMAKKEGVSDRVTFEQHAADQIPDHKFDLVAYFDCLHDMGDPLGACKRAKAVLKPDGCIMMVEPMAGKTIEENFNEVGRAFTGASVLCCTPNAIASGGTALGTVATDDALAGIFKSAGFSKFRRAAETPFNRVFEARL